jgi:class 3 adenylate cyclase
VFYDYQKRKIVNVKEDKSSLLNWGALRNGKEYDTVIASVDICQNSELVRKHKPGMMEKVYYRLWSFLKHKLDLYEGRIWSWAGDGGLFAFRGEKSIPDGVSCALEILYGLPVFNIQPYKPIKDEIALRIGMDFGGVKFFEDTGRIVSDVINYAAHLEKQATKPSSLSISNDIYTKLPPSMKAVFTEKQEFEGKTAWSTSGIP